MKELTKSSIKVLANLSKAKRPLAVKRIAERTNLSWKTADNSIKQLERRKLVKCKRSERRTYCQVSRDIKKLLK